MILAPAQREVALYRAFMPRWAAEPLSGAGAALADLARELGHAGIIFPSQTSPEGVNVVLFADVLPLDQLLTVVDPDGVLPRDGRSWGALLWRCTRTRCCGVGFSAAMVFSSCTCPHGARTAIRSCGQGDCTGVSSVPFVASAGSDRPSHALRLILLVVCWRCLADAQRVRHMV